VAPSMSLLSRVLPPLPASRRAYSSFFSSKPGGGRYFNSAKPPKSVVNATKTKTNNTKVNDSAVNGGSNGKVKASGVEESSMTNTTSHDTHHSTMPHATSMSHLLPPSTMSSEQFMVPRHSVMSAQDYKLHQFFSLHRPLLLHSQPTSAIFESPSPLFDIFTPPSEGKASPAPAQLGTLDNPPEVSNEADADAARQLARALVMNRVGSTVSWEDTLMKLGIDENTEERAQLAKEWAREWDTVYADSVKRKRKKKMKKHKLKKRRRAQRSQKLKHG